MKWKNKGHEYDETYLQISKKSKFYLFGAGDYGNQFWQIFKEELNIAGYIDNDVNKQGTEINGKVCLALDDIQLSKADGVIITMSQIARVRPIEQLKALGYKKNIDYFIIEEFLSVYYVYKYNEVYLSSISFLPSTICNLNCRYCLNFNPFAKKFYSRDWNSLVQDVDLFFSCVDHVMLFHVSGGEPMLYEHTADIIEYIDSKYRNKINTLRTVTNGTVLPSDEMLNRLSKCKIEVTIDDYREAVPKYKDRFDFLIDKFEKYGIKYSINKAVGWIDLAPEKTDYSGYSEEKLEQHREECSQSWQELRGGKLYSCNYAAYATVAGIAGEEDCEEVFDLKNFIPEKKKELVEFRLGFTAKGYTNFCKRCRGFTKWNTEEVEPACQCLKNEKLWNAVGLKG